MRFIVLLNISCPHLTGIAWIVLCQFLCFILFFISLQFCTWKFTSQSSSLLPSPIFGSNIKGNQNPISPLGLLYYKVFIIENNQWKFEQNQAKNKEVTALWNLANLLLHKRAIFKMVASNGQLSISFCTWNFMFFHFSESMTETISFI